MVADQELVLCRLCPSTGIHRAFRWESVTRAIQRYVELALGSWTGLVLGHRCFLCKTFEFVFQTAHFVLYLAGFRYPRTDSSSKAPVRFLCIFFVWIPSPLIYMECFSLTLSKLMIGFQKWFCIL